MKQNTKKITDYASLIIVFLSLLVFKLYINHFLLAEDGDTYDFFRMSYFFKHFIYPIYAKRMPLLPILISFTNPENFVLWGRIVSNLFYFSSIVMFFFLSEFYVKNKTLRYITTLIFTFNIVIFNNSFYINADNLFLFFTLTFLYVYKKYGLNIPILAFIAALAFYTRIEGILLFAALGIYLLINKQWSKAVLFASIGFLFLSPYLFRNIFLFGNPIFSNYSTDTTGFNLTLKNIFLALSNFILLLGGVWFLPTVYLLNNNKIFIHKKYLTVEVLTFLFISIILILWSPVVRLYSFIVSMLLIYLGYLLDTATSSNIVDKKKLLVSILLFFASVICYIISVQIFNQKDLGMFKIAKGISLLFSVPIFYFIFKYIKFKNLKNNYLLIAAVFIIFINIFVFLDKFRFTRYKYYTLVQVVNSYNLGFKYIGNIGYTDESGVEMWYLNDYNERYNFLSSNIYDFKDWTKQNNIRYLIITQEMAGHYDFRVKKYKADLDKMPIIIDYRTPFFGGYTKLIDISHL